MECARVCVLSTCGHNRGNRAPCAGRAISASLRPLDIHEYVFGSQSCINRLVLLRCARLRPPIVTAFVTLVEFGAVARDTARARSSSSSLPFAGVLLPLIPLAIRVAMLRRRDTAFSPRLRLPALSANRSPPSRSAPPRHPSRTSPRWRCVSFAQSAAALSAPPW